MDNQTSGPSRDTRAVVVLLAAFGLVVVAIAMTLRAQASHPSPPPPEAYRLPSVSEDGVDEWARHVNPKARSFEQFDDFARLINTSQKLVLYEGLPHQYWEPEAFAQEKAVEPTIELNDWPFYPPPITLSSADESKFGRLFANRDGFVPYRGTKNCGGFQFLQNWV